MTQKELAEAIGMTQEHLSALANGKHDIHLSKAKMIADRLGIKVDDLISGDEW